MEITPGYSLPWKTLQVLHHSWTAGASGQNREGRRLPSLIVTRHTGDIESSNCRSRWGTFLILDSSSSWRESLPIRATRGLAMQPNGIKLGIWNEERKSSSLAFDILASRAAMDGIVFQPHSYLETPLSSHLVAVSGDRVCEILLRIKEHLRGGPKPSSNGLYEQGKISLSHPPSLSLPPSVSPHPSLPPSLCLLLCHMRAQWEGTSLKARTIPHHEPHLADFLILDTQSPELSSLLFICCSFGGAEDGTQGLVHARQAPCQLSCTPAPASRTMSRHIALV